MMVTARRAWLGLGLVVLALLSMGMLLDPPSAEPAADRDCADDWTLLSRFIKPKGSAERAVRKGADSTDPSETESSPVDASDRQLLEDTAAACEMEAEDLEALVAEHDLLGDLKAVRSLLPEGQEDHFPRLARTFVEGVKAIHQNPNGTASGRQPEEEVAAEAGDDR